MKRCSRCGLILPKPMFNKNRSRWDGLDEYCKACRNDYQRRYNGHAGPNKQERELLVASHTALNPPQKERRERFIQEYVENLGKNML